MPHRNTALQQRPQQPASNSRLTWLVTSRLCWALCQLLPHPSPPPVHLATRSNQHSGRAASSARALQHDAEAADKDCQAPPPADLHITVSIRRKGSASPPRASPSSSPRKPERAARSRILDTFDFASLESEERGARSWEREPSPPRRSTASRQGGGQSPRPLAEAHPDSWAAEHGDPDPASSPGPSQLAHQPLQPNALECWPHVRAHGSSESIQPRASGGAEGLPLEEGAIVRTRKVRRLEKPWRGPSWCLLCRSPV